MEEERQTPLTVVQLTSSSNRSGGTRQVLLLCEGLQARGHRVILGGPKRSPALAWARGHGFEAVTLSAGTLRETWKAARALRRLARDVGADVVHAHHTRGHNLALLATLGGRLPPVVANRGVVFRPAFPLKFRSRRTAAIITNSEAARSVLVRVGVRGEKIHVVYNAKDAPDLVALGGRIPGLRAELGLEGAGPVIGAVGSGKPGKGFSYLLEAAPKILACHPGAVFVLVGAGTERLRARISELGLAAHVRLPGHRSDAVDIMGTFDVFVLPSLSESCPNVLLEAQSVGLPSVCSDVGGVGEILEGGRFGRLVPPADPAALAEGVCGVLSSPALALAAGQGAREALLERFSLARKVEGTLAVYNRVLRLRRDRVR